MSEYKVKITQHHSGSWPNHTYPEITEINWKAVELDESFLNKFPNLENLNCENNGITSLEPIYKLTKLKELNCYNNLIHSLDPLLQLTNLQKLNCGMNKLSSLNSLTNCFKLEELNCCFNLISSLDPLTQCSNIKNLFCHNNKINTLHPLSHLDKLHVLNCSKNEIISLEPLSKCTDIRMIECNDNQISSLISLAQCTQITLLYCHNNRITSLEPLIYLRRLFFFQIQNNPLDPPTIQIQRLLNRLERVNTRSSIYLDGQNIHDSHIQRTVCQSVQNILKDPKPEFHLDQLIHSGINDKVISILLDFIQESTIHSIHLISYPELFSYVWQRIIKSNSKQELLKILEEQIIDSECKCFTGRFNRTLSVLVGFYDDIRIEISDNSRIGAIILTTKQRVKPYNLYDHQELAKKTLLELGYTENEINPWLETIE